MRGEITNIVCVILDAYICSLFCLRCLMDAYWDEAGNINEGDGLCAKLDNTCSTTGHKYGSARKDHCRAGMWGQCC